MQNLYKDPYIESAPALIFQAVTINMHFLILLDSTSLVAIAEVVVGSIQTKILAAIL